MVFLDAGIKKFSQWFPGWENNVADALLCDFDRSNNNLTQILHNTCPSQFPHHFQIVPLRNKISSWLTLLLQKLPVREQLREAHTKTKLGCGNDSLCISTPLDSATTLTSNPSHDPNKTGSLEPLPWLTGRDNIWERLMTPWLQEHKIPSWMYLQPSGKMGDLTQPKTRIYSVASFYNDNSVPSKTKTQRKSNRRPPLPGSLPKSPRDNLQS